MQSATYVNPVGSDERILYAGDGNTPTQVALAKKYAALEGAEDAIVVASGMAATALAHLAVLRPGDHLVASRWIYGGTQRLFDEELARFGITISYVSPDEPRLWRKSVRKETRAVFVETPTESPAPGARSRADPEGRQRVRAGAAGHRPRLPHDAGDGGLPLLAPRPPWPPP